MATKVTKTIGPGTGDDYASLAALAVDSQDLVTADEYWEVTCANQEESTIATFNGWTTDSTRYLHIKAADSHGSTGRITTSAWRMNRAVAGASVNVSGSGMGSGGFLIFEGMQFRQTGGAGSSHNMYLYSLDNTVTVRCINCVFDGGYYGIHVNDADATLDLINCWLLEAGRCIYNQIGTSNLYHCTFKGGTDPVAINGGTINAKNCYSGDGGDVDWKVWAGTLNMTKCASSDSSGSETSLQSIAWSTDNFRVVTLGSEDMRLAAGSALIGVGADLSGESAPFNVSVDIEGDSRNTATPDIGTDERDAFSSERRNAALFVIGF